MGTSLVTLSQVAAYLQLTPTQAADDPMLPLLIPSASAEFLKYTSLPYIAQTTFTERRNGTGTASITLRNRPCQSVTSLVISNVTIKPSPDGVQAGYYLDAYDPLTGAGGTTIYLVGGYTAQSAPFYAIGYQGYPPNFMRGFGNVVIQGTAGYPNVEVTGEIQTVPNAAPYQCTLVQGATFLGASTLTVIYQNTGLPLTQVMGTPSQGQYVVAPNGALTFSINDAATVMICSYTCTGIPYDIQKCVYEMVGWAYKNRDRIGKSTAHFADSLSETYAQTPFSPSSKLTINRYTRKDAVGW